MASSPSPNRSLHRPNWASGSRQRSSPTSISAANPHSPALTRTHERLWFGINKPWPKDTPAGDFSIRWTGFIEPRFTEDYCFSIYARGEFKLWIDGKEVTWAPQDYPRDREVRKGHSQPIPLQFGKRVPIRIEYRAVPMDPKSPEPGPSFHLNWESLSQPVEHVPTAALLLP